MTICANCGAQAPTGVQYCPSCGQPAAVPPQAQQFGPTSAPAAPTGYPPSAPTAGYAVQSTGAPFAVNPQDAENNKVMAILAYIIFFIPLLTGDHKKSPFVKFHANQGLVLFLANIAWGFIWMILSVITLGFLALLAPLAMLVPLVWVVLGIVNAAKLQATPLPLIGGITLLK